MSQANQSSLLTKLFSWETPKTAKEELLETKREADRELGKLRIKQRIILKKLERSNIQLEIALDRGDDVGAQVHADEIAQYNQEIQDTKQIMKELASQRRAVTLTSHNADLNTMSRSTMQSIQKMNAEMGGIRGARVSVPHAMRVMHTAQTINESRREITEEMNDHFEYDEEEDEDVSSIMKGEGGNASQSTNPAVILQHRREMRRLNQMPSVPNAWYAQEKHRSRYSVPEEGGLDNYPRFSLARDDDSK